MTVLDEFMQNPAQFMRFNHVACKGIMPVDPGEYTFVLVPFGGTARRRGGVFLGKSTGKADAGAYEIRHSGSWINANQRAAGEEFTAYWGGYQVGGTAECALDGTGSALMLTPELTGCTVSFVAGANGHARFSHYNLKNDTRTLDAPEMVARVRSDYAGETGVGILTKEHYNGKSGADLRDHDQLNRFQKLVKKNLPMNTRGRPTANVIGWRNSGQWEFWVQYSDEKGSVRQVLNVKRLTPGLHTG